MKHHNGSSHNLTSENKCSRMVRFLAMAGVGVLTLTGCGSQKENYTDTAMTALSQQSYTVALQNFEQGIAAGEDKETIYRGMGLTYMGEGYYGKAITAFQDALSSAGMFPGEMEYDIDYYMAISYYKLGEYESAVSVYDSIIELHPKDAKAYYLRGYMKLYLSDVEGATADFDQAIECNVNDCSLYLDMYEALQQHSYSDQAQNYLDRMLTVDESKLSNYDKARYMYYQGDYEKACNFLELVRTEDPESVDAEMITFLGECYQKNGNYTYAIAVYQGYVDSTPDAEIYNQLGLCYINQKDYENALLAFQNGQTVLENNTCMQTLKLNEIACYEYLLDFDTAQEKLEEYMQTYPVTPEIQKEYAFLSTR